MNEKLSERSVKWRVDHDVLGGEVNVRAMTRKQVAAEIADLEAKLEAMSQVIEVVRAVLPNMIAKGPLSEASRLDFALQEFDAAQQEQEE